MTSSRRNRIPVMMTDEELASIDDWRFANRVATRSGAIRRLCQIGMETGRVHTSTEVLASNDILSKREDAA